jgi:bacterioferritin (cytochrome b1)
MIMEEKAMESSIAALSMSMAMSNVQNSVSVGMLKKTMDASEESMEKMTEMLDDMPSPDGKGTVLNVLA